VFSKNTDVRFGAESHVGVFREHASVRSRATGGR